jgi:hypothetical protein
MILTDGKYSVNSLTKFEIENLRGGKLNGENVFVICNCGFQEHISLSAQLLTQCRSQKTPHLFPGGHEPFLTKSFPRELRYDIEREKIWIPIPRRREWTPAGIYMKKELVPAWIFRVIPGHEAFPQFHAYSELWKARIALIHQMHRSWGDAIQLGSLMADKLGIRWEVRSPTSLEARLIDLATRMDQQTCVDLIDLLRVAPDGYAQAA